MVRPSQRPSRWPQLLRVGRRAMIPNFPKWRASPPLPEDSSLARPGDAARRLASPPQKQARVGAPATFFPRREKGRRPSQRAPPSGRLAPEARFRPRPLRPRLGVYLQVNKPRVALRSPCHKASEACAREGRRRCLDYNPWRRTLRPRGPAGPGEDRQEPPGLGSQDGAHLILLAVRAGLFARCGARSGVEWRGSTIATPLKCRAASPAGRYPGKFTAKGGRRTAGGLGGALDCARCAPDRGNHADMEPGRPGLSRGTPQRRSHSTAATASQRGRAAAKSSRTPLG